MASSEITDWEDVPVKDEPTDWEDVPVKEGPGHLESIAAGAKDLLLAGFGDSLPTQEQILRRFKKDASGQLQDSGQDVPQETVVAENRARTAQAHADHPRDFAVGQGAGFLAAGGARAIASLPKAIPAAVRGLATAEGRIAALTAARTGTAGGAAAAGLSAAGHGDEAHVSEEMQKGGLFGAILGGFFGAAPAARAPLQDAADAAATKTGQAEMVEQFDALRAAHPEKLAAHQEQVGQIKAGYADELAAHRAKVAEAREAYRESLRQHRADMLERKTAYEKARDEHASAAETADREHAAAQAAALRESQTSSRDAALQFAGLEGKQRSLGGPQRAKEVGQELFDYRLESGGRMTDTLAANKPEDALKLVQGLKEQAGQQLGAIRAKLAAIPAARVRAEDVQAAVHEPFMTWPSDARAKALEYVDQKIAAAMRDGALPAQAVQALIEDMSGAAKYGAPNLEAALGDRAKDVYRTARGSLSDAYKGMIGKHLPDELPSYETALKQYGTFSNAETGQKVRMGRELKGQPDLRTPKPAPVAPPELPPAPERPAPLPRPAAPQLPPAPARPQLPAAPAAPAVPAGLDEARAALQPELGLRERAVATGAGMAGRVAGTALGGRALGAVTSSAASGAVRNWLSSVAPTAASLTGKAVKAQEAVAALERFAPAFEKALREGPRAVAVLHRVLMTSSPVYREAVAPGEPNDFQDVTARAEPENAPPAETAPPTEAPADDQPDIFSTPEMDAAVKAHLAAHADQIHKRKETGWELQEDDSVPEHPALSLGEPIKGEGDYVEFHRLPGRVKHEHVKGTVHTHPLVPGARKNRANRMPSKDDEQLVTVGGAPAYVVGTDGVLRVMERRGGKLVVREVE